MTFHGGTVQVLPAKWKVNLAQRRSTGEFRSSGEPPASKEERTQHPP